MPDLSSYTHNISSDQGTNPSTKEVQQLTYAHELLSCCHRRHHPEAAGLTAWWNPRDCFSKVNHAMGEQFLWLKKKKKVLLYINLKCWTAVLRSWSIAKVYMFCAILKTRFYHMCVGLPWDLYSGNQEHKSRMSTVVDIQHSATV